MKRVFVGVLAASSFLAIAVSANAQTTGDSANSDAAAQERNDVSDTTETGEIIVTARRKNESLQDVPLTVSAVTRDTVEKLAFRSFEDISKVVSGLQLTGSNNFNATASARGVTFNNVSASSATVAAYVNEVPVTSTVAFQNI